MFSINLDMFNIAMDRSDHRGILPVATVLAFCTRIDLSLTYLEGVRRRMIALLEGSVVRLVMPAYSTHKLHIATDRSDHTGILPVAMVLAFCTCIDLS